MTIALLCSGQGQQSPDMFEGLADSPGAEALFAHAAQWFDGDPRDWIVRAERTALHENRNAQLLCALHALLTFGKAAPSLPERRCVAGYSVGEVVAWHVAGYIDAGETLDLVAARATTMDATRHGVEGMLFVRGLDRHDVLALCEDRDAAIAIVNPGGAFVLAGLSDALSAIATDARARGASRVVPVPVQIASHTARLAGAVAPFSRILAALPLSGAHEGTRLISGLDGASVLDARIGLEKLARQIAEPVEWETCLNACVEAGVEGFLELGPGRALAEMAAAAFPAMPSRSMDDFKSGDALTIWLRRVLAR